jgi:hypothetical protein
MALHGLLQGYLYFILPFLSIFYTSLNAMLSVVSYSMPGRWKKVTKDEAKEKEEDRETWHVASKGARPEKEQGTQELPDLLQGEQSLSSWVNELLRNILDGKEEDKPPMQPLPPTQQISSSPTEVQYRILTRQQKNTHTNHSNVDSGEGLLQQEQSRHKIHVPEQAGYHNQPNRESTMHETNEEPSLSKTSHNYPGYQTGLQELPKHQTVNTQMQSLYGHTFLQEAPHNHTPQMAYDQQYNVIGQVGLNYVPQGPSEFNLLLHLQGFPRLPVVCPLAMLPSGACPWKGESRYRKMHVEMNHMNYIASSNVIRLSHNCVTIMNAYTEYFLCYAVTVSDPDKLYCVVQHACTSYNCMLTYQYRCDIYAENRYEKISITRLVGHFQDDFNTLTQMGNCLSLDRETVNSFTGNDGFYVNVTVLIPEPF